MASFVKRCLSGSESLDKINDYIIAWQTGGGGGQTLRKFLGMTPDEFMVWVRTGIACIDPRRRPKEV